MNDLCLITISTHLYAFFTYNLLGMGTLLVLNEMLFFTYTRKMIWKRHSFCNDDIFGTFLELANLVIAFGLAGVHSYGRNFAMNFEHQFKKDLELLPNIR